MIKNFVFDFGRVLVDYHFESVFRTFFSEEREEDFQEYCQLFLDEDFVNRIDKEETPLEEILEELKQNNPHLAHEIDLFLIHFYDFITGEVKGMYQVLSWLKGKGFRLYGLTNWSHLVYKVMDDYPIFKLLDGAIISSEEHLIKPEKEIYQRLCEKYQLEPTECFFTDDKIVNIEGASKIGIRGVVFTDATHYVNDLKNVLPSMSEELSHLKL